MIFLNKQMTIRLITAYFCLAAGLTLSTATWGNTAGVFPPVVNEEHRSMQYRITIDPDSGAWGTRLHYQQSLDGSVMLRGIIHGSKMRSGTQPSILLKLSCFGTSVMTAANFARGFDSMLEYRIALNLRYSVLTMARATSSMMHGMDEWRY